MLLTMKINLFSFTIPILQHPLCLYHKISTFLLQCNSKLAWVAGTWKQWPKERTGAWQLFFLVPTTSKCLLCRLTPSYFVGTWQYIPNCFNCSKSLYFYNERLWGNAGLCGAFEKYKVMCTRTECMGELPYPLPLKLQVTKRAYELFFFFWSIWSILMYNFLLLFIILYKTFSLYHFYI